MRSPFTPSLTGYLTYLGSETKRVTRVPVFPTVHSYRSSIHGTLQDGMRLPWHPIPSH